MFDKYCIIKLYHILHYIPNHTIHVNSDNSELFIVQQLHDIFE